MQPKMCTKCTKNIAVVFITKIENGVTLNEGYCLKCARSLGIPQIDAAEIFDGPEEVALSEGTPVRAAAGENGQRSVSAGLHTFQRLPYRVVVIKVCTAGLRRQEK